MTAERKENKMGVMPVRKLHISMSLPMMISMLVQALYNIVDSFFVARISDIKEETDSAIAATGLAFPSQNLIIGFATGTGLPSLSSASMTV